MLNFELFISDCSLFDLGFNGSRFAWCNGQQDQDSIRERIDRAMGNAEYCKHFPRTQVFYIDPMGSNHHLLLVDLNFTSSKTPWTF